MPTFLNSGNIFLLDGQGCRLQIYIKNGLNICCDMCHNSSSQTVGVCTPSGGEMEKFIIELLSKCTQNGSNRRVNNLFDLFACVHLRYDAIQGEVWNSGYPFICLLFLLIHCGGIRTYHFANDDQTHQYYLIKMTKKEFHPVVQILGQFWKSYTNTTPVKLKIIDSFIVYCIMLAAIQFLYFLIAGDFPRNALISGLFAPIGSLTVTLCLRKQMNPETRYMNISDERTFWEFFVCMLTLFLTVVNFIG